MQGFLDPAPTPQPLPSGVRLRVAPGGRLSNLEEELENPDPPRAAEVLWVGRKMAAASVSATSGSQISVRRGRRSNSLGPGAFFLFLTLQSALGPESQPSQGCLVAPCSSHAYCSSVEAAPLPRNRPGPPPSPVLPSPSGLAAQVAELCQDSLGCLPTPWPGENIAALVTWV